MSAQHTPGPWEIRPPRIGAAITIYAERAGIYRDVPIATTCSNGSPATMDLHRRGEAVPNARLIAAAPDLLNALEIAAAGLRWYQDTYPESVDGSDEEAMAEIDAAIAQATGAAS